MSDHTHASGVRSLALAAVLAGASLSIPTNTQAQDTGPETALMNRTVIATTLGVDLRAMWAPPAVPDPESEVGGEQALLGRVIAGQAQAGAPEPTTAASEAEVPRADGERALLSRAASPEIRGKSTGAGS